MPLSRRYQPSFAPDEASIIGMDFSYVIPPGVGIQDGLLSFWTNTANPVDATADFTIGPIQIFGRTVYASITGGFDGRDYQVRWLVVDTDANLWRRTALMLCAQTS